MDRLSKNPKEHITAIFEDYEASARVLQTLTNLSNTVIETALSGQCKFLFEILQNADDAFDDQSKYNDIKLQLILSEDYFIIQHNGKVFNYYDVERICDYASQIEEVKANDLSKTGYKGLGFKSLFNLTDCIYVYSNGYSFRFDKNFWPDPEKKPWQVIPIWCDNLPLNERYTYDQPVNFIMKVNDQKQLNIQLKELIDHPEVLLYLHRVKIVHLNQNGMEIILERKVEKLGLFQKIVFVKNHSTSSTWLSRTYERDIPLQLRKCIREVSQFIYPDKIKNAKEVDFTFTLCTRQEDVSKIDGFCYNTLPTQLKLSLPYHVNSLFILNLDRTQFHENDWNEFLVYQVGYFQLSFLKDIAELPNLKNFVIDLLVREINHSYSVFNKAFSKGFIEAKKQIAWLPAYKGHLLKLGEACVDEIHFFKQNFQNVRDRQCGYVIDYDVNKQDRLDQSEAIRFNYDSLFDKFPEYYKQLTESSYKTFLSYICEISEKNPLSLSKYKLENTPFLKTKNGKLISPREALLEEEENPIPDFAGLNPIDNKCLPETESIRASFKNWLVDLGAKRLKKPIHILRKSVFQWIESDTLRFKMNINNHKAIIEYLAKNVEQLATKETKKLKEKLLILTKSNKFKIVTSCCLPNAITLEELGDVMSDDEIISPCYDMFSLKDFFSHLGISDKLEPIEVFRKCILVWIGENKMRYKFTTENYKPIIEFLSSEYQKIWYKLKQEEIKQLGELPILTCTRIFYQAKDCYFDTAVPDVNGFEDIIDKKILVSTENFNDVVREFLSCIGVKEKIHPKDVIRESVLKWIENRIVLSRINISNHYGIVRYIAEHWGDLYELESEEKKTLKKLPVLTKNDNFREVYTCFWQSRAGSIDEIPKLDLIVSADELVSSEYYKIPKLKLSTASTNELKNYTLKKEECSKIKILLSVLGVRNLKFIDIYDRYCNHLTEPKSAEWFFSNLIKYWNSNRLHINENKLLKDLKVKLQSSYVLSKNGKLYPVTELYSSCFINIHSMDGNEVPVLVFEHLPEELEEWLGIKQEIELPCIVKLMAAIDKKQNLGEKDTLIFFTFLLEQLLLKNKDEIKKYSLKLLSNDNKLTLAKELYYFEEEDAVCYADSYYLKRIHGMTHDDTLVLAELCGVNILSFNYEVNVGEQAPTCDKTLTEFYLERLPLIVFQESKEINESPQAVFKKLFSKVNSFDLYKCQNILIKYPFGEPVRRRYHFDFPKIYVIRNWIKVKSKIHEYIKKILELKSDISDILDLESDEDKAEWLEYQEDPQKHLVIKELESLNKLLSSQEIDYIATDTCDSVNDGTNSNQISESLNKLLSSLEIDYIATDTCDSVNDGTNSNQISVKEDVDFISPDDLLIKQDTDFKQGKASTVNQSDDSESESSDDLLFKQGTDFKQGKTSTGNQSDDSESESCDDLLIKQDTDFKQGKALTVNRSDDSENDSCDDLLFEQDVNSTRLESVTTDESASSVGEIINNDDSFKQDINFEQIKAPIVHQSVDSGIKKESNEEDIRSNKGLLLHHSVSSGPLKIATVNKSGDFGNNSIISDNLLKQDVDFEEVTAASINQHSDLKNGQNSMSLPKNVNSGLEKPTYDNTLKEFYFQRLPVIVQWELKKQKRTATEILESLHNKISSLELYQCSDICIQYPNSYIVETDCFFDGLKIYVVGKWFDRKLKIHQYIKEKLGLTVELAIVESAVCESISNDDSFKQDIGFEQIKAPIVHQSVDSGSKKISNEKDFRCSDVSVMINVESISQMVENKRICSEDESKKLHQIDDKQDIGFEQIKAPIVHQSVDSGSKKRSNEKDFRCSDVSMINVESISRVVKKKRICPEDESQKLHQIDEGIKTLVAAEKTLTNKLQFTNDKETPKDVELSDNKKFIAGAYSDGNLEDSSDYRHSLSRSCYSIKFKGTKVLISFVEGTRFFEEYNPTSDHLDEDIIKINVKTTKRKQSTCYKNRAPKILTSKNYSLPLPVNLHVNPHRLLQVVTDDESHFKRLGEKYVFIYLQNYYKNKYPDAQMNSEHACFTLHWQSHTTEIIWLNDDEDKRLEYDLLLKKNEEVKQYIAVKSVNQAKSDLFNMIHSIFARRNKFATEHPEYNAQYCVYCILYEDDSSVPFPEKMANVNALYKIISLKLPSV